MRLSPAPVKSCMAFHSKNSKKTAARVLLRMHVAPPDRGHVKTALVGSMVGDVSACWAPSDLRNRLTSRSEALQALANVEATRELPRLFPVARRALP
jgi:hypothetical protein